MVFRNAGSVFIPGLCSNRHPSYYSHFRSSILVNSHNGRTILHVLNDRDSGDQLDLVFVLDGRRTLDLFSIRVST